MSAKLIGLLLLVSLNNADELELRVRPHIALAPSDIRVEVYLSKAEHHRYLRVELLAVDGPVRSSEQTIDGENAPVLYVYEWKGYGPGQYTVLARVFSLSHVLHTSSQNVELLGP